VTVKIVFGSPVPVSVGVLSRVSEAFAGEIIVGATGAVVSTVKVARDGELVLPRLSILVIERA
jgi:hypothetical protein